MKIQDFQGTKMLRIFCVNPRSSERNFWFKENALHFLERKIPDFAVPKTRMQSEERKAPPFRARITKILRFLEQEMPCISL